MKQVKIATREEYIKPSSGYLLIQHIHNLKKISPKLAIEVKCKVT
jgi:hypothetical protein